MPAESNSPVSGQPMRERVIQVFISSTFRDMVDECNDLMTHSYHDDFLTWSSSAAPEPPKQQP